MMSCLSTDSSVNSVRLTVSCGVGAQALFQDAINLVHLIERSLRPAFILDDTLHFFA